MAQQTGAVPPLAGSFEYELFEGDPEHLRTVVVTSTQSSSWIDPSSLKLKYRIGRGPFGDVWLATHHRTGDDYDEFHEVAVKMLHPMKKDSMQAFLEKLDILFVKFRGLHGVCWMHGFSIKSGKVCIAMKFYKGSLDDHIAQLKGGKLPLSDVLRYGIQLAKGTEELHSLSILLLNLKPSNFLLNEYGHVALGEFGIPYLLLGIPLPDSDLAVQLGTPNYMAPEQWEPKVRGPLCFETDSWGFGCSILEMLTGVPPWFGRSIKEIHQLVVRKKEKPQVPGGLPPDVESVLKGCFEYDPRNRPLMADISQAFERSQNAVHGDGGWIGLGSTNNAERTSSSSSSSSFTVWFLSKHHLQVGDTVRSRKPLNQSKPEKLDVPEGTIVGLESDGFAFIRVRGAHNSRRVQVSTLERVTSGMSAGDWVHLKDENENSHHSSVGILHSIGRDGGSAAVGFIGLETLWAGSSSALELCRGFSAAQFVKPKGNVVTPRFEWPRKSGGGGRGGGGPFATGKISEVLSNGCLVLTFPGRFVFRDDEPSRFLADPAEVELVSFDSCPGLVQKYQHIEDLHWGVRPLVVGLGLLLAAKSSFFIGRNVNAKLKEARRDRTEDGWKGRRKNRAWLPWPVANFHFEGASAAAAAGR